MKTERIKTFREFYPYYLNEHQNYISRLLHFIGTTLFFVFIMGAFLFHNINFLWACPVAGYGFAWVGHFFFEKNKWITFQYPLFSLLSDFKLYFEILAGAQKLRV
ncbi:MAG: DUF962 domain-containing protein [Bacteroidia bacterium]|nr:DUF962 domain-containing protein [Bacteroidia bacterium]